MTRRLRAGGDSIERSLQDLTTAERRLRDTYGEAPIPRAYTDAIAAVRKSIEARAAGRRRCGCGEERPEAFARADAGEPMFDHQTHEGVVPRPGNTCDSCVRGLEIASKPRV